MLTRAQRRATAHAEFTRQNNRRIRDSVIQRVADWSEARLSAAPVIQELLQEVGGATVLDYCNTAAHLLTVEEVTSAAKQSMVRWNRQRKALERALGSGALQYNRAICGWRTRTGAKVSIGMYAAVRVTEHWLEAQSIYNAVLVQIDRKTAPESVCRWIDRELEYHNRVQVYYSTPDRIVDFVRGLRAVMRASKRELPFNLGCLALET